jgi:hypothetical protein
MLDIDNMRVLKVKIVISVFYFFDRDFPGIFILGDASASSKEGLSVAGI